MPIPAFLWRPECGLRYHRGEIGRNGLKRVSVRFFFLCFSPVLQQKKYKLSDLLSLEAKF